MQGITCGMWESVMRMRFTNPSDDPHYDFAPSPTCNCSQVQFGDVIAGRTQSIRLCRNRRNDLYVDATWLRKIKQGGVTK